MIRGRFHKRVKINKQTKITALTKLVFMTFLHSFERPFLLLLFIVQSYNFFHLRHSSIGNLRHSPPPLFLWSLITETKASPLSPVLVVADHLQTLLLGSFFADPYPHVSIFLRTSVSAFQVKHVYRYFHSFNTFATRIAVVILICCLAVEFISDCNRSNLSDV